ncbi:5-formyltetrahydrofolate cyclo-ligase [Campylobacter sp. 7477a]|uniref:5-formyltetrahydrofolate cyclo-ligase n=1 Tax=Campylobacter sp. 7477a TaxID=2735741 RepID=UPI0030149335|nr:5-formyltetrahydrofolate cyclo-ligase [Campylobacter sp. 7477a]
MKKDIRIKNFKEMNKIIDRTAKAKHYAVLKTLLNLIELSKSKNILFFMPLRYEPDVYSIRRNLSKKCNIFIPFMVGLSLKMVELKMPFVRSKFNVREPLSKKSSTRRLDMAVVPVIGVDATMARIGHGKGFYDRFFSGLSYRPKLIVFVQIKDFYIDKILSQDHDIRGDIYLTPKQNYIKRGIYDRDFNRLRSRCGGRWRRVSVY